MRRRVLQRIQARRRVRVQQLEPRSPRCSGALASSRRERKLGMRRSRDAEHRAGSRAPSVCTAVYSGALIRVVFKHRADHT